MTESEKLYEMLRKVQEPKGFYFNMDKERVFELLEALLVNKERYGYMVCPCRLSTGEREKDKDIICPSAEPPFVQHFFSYDFRLANEIISFLRDGVTPSRCGQAK